MKASEVGALANVLARDVLSYHDEKFTFKDVIDSAWVRGDLESAWHRLLTGLSAEKRAEELGLQADDNELQSMSEEFRYERELLTAEETETWLTGRDLTEDDFGGYFLRRYWASQGEQPGPPEPISFPQASPEQMDLLCRELLMSGEFTCLASDFAWRTIASAEEALPERQDVSVELDSFLARSGLDAAALPLVLECLERTPEWLTCQLRMESAYRGVCARVTTNELRARMAAVMRIPLTRLEIETIILASNDAAREAVLCLREGETTVQDLAQECGATFEWREVFLGDCDEAVQRALLCASLGEILEPRRCESGFAVCRLLSKVEPIPEDAQVRARLDQRLLESHFEALASNQISWLWPSKCPA